MQDHPSLVALPAAYEVLLPALGELELPDETLATCQDCPQGAPAGEAPSLLRPFDRDVACCTYRPTLPNYLVGRALGRGDRGSEKLWERIQAYDEGLTAAGIFPPAKYKELYVEAAFGVDRRLTCAYWVDEPLSCSIWRDRNAVCRTWYCRMTDGPRAHIVWNTVRDALATLEQTLSVHLADTGQPPAAGAPKEAWRDWYLDCYARFEAEDLTTLVDRVALPERDGLTVALKVYSELHGMPVPERIFPVLTAMERTEDGDLLVQGHSRLDTVQVPQSFMGLFGKLVHGTPWRQALEELAQDGIAFEDGFVEHLWRRGIVTWPVNLENPPELQAWLDLCEREGVEDPLKHTPTLRPELASSPPGRPEDRA